MNQDTFPLSEAMVWMSQRHGPTVSFQLEDYDDDDIMIMVYLYSHEKSYIVTGVLNAK